jgi:hypothetical protein
MVRVTSSSGVANIMHFKNRQVPLPHPVFLQNEEMLEE